ncbi:MAG: hypothetical protein RI544_02085 [Haloquadratum sp.]|nr:hypothetical protein [Haloquadratum sp.]
MRLYKTVTVFSTLTAVVLVVVGFLFLDAATLSISLLGSAIRGLVAAVGVTASPEVWTTLFAVCGIACITAGAGVYILGSRFTSPQMRKSQATVEGDTDNG